MLNIPSNDYARMEEELELKQHTLLLCCAWYFIVIRFSRPPLRDIYICVNFALAIVYKLEKQISNHSQNSEPNPVWMTCIYYATWITICNCLQIILFGVECSIVDRIFRWFANPFHRQLSRERKYAVRERLIGIRNRESGKEG